MPPLELPRSHVNELVLDGPHADAFDAITNGREILGLARPTFQIFNSAKDVLSIHPEVGVGVATFGRSDADATLVDFEGVVRQVQASEARFQGARRVFNVFAVGADVTGYPTNTDVIPTGEHGVDNGGTYTEESGYGVVDISDQSSSRVWLGNFDSIARQNGDVFVYSFEMARHDQDGLFGMRIRTGNTLDDGDFLVPLTADFRRYAITATLQNYAGSGGFYCYLGDRRVIGTTALTARIRNVQLERVTGQSNQSAGEYLSIDVDHGVSENGVKYFATQNANTVSANVVSSGEGARLSTVKGYLHEPARTNLVTQSESTTGWIAGNTTVADNAAVAPSGLSTAISVNETTAAGGHYFATPSISFTNAADYTLAAFLKMLGSDSIFQLTFPSSAFGSQYANFDLSGAGSVGTVVGGDAVIESIGNGWFRCAFTATATATVSEGAGVVCTNNNDGSGRLPSYVGDVSEGVYVWGAQCEVGSVCSSYIPTAGSAVTRADDSLEYSNANVPTALGCFETVWRVSWEQLDDDVDTNIWSVEALAAQGGVFVRDENASTYRLDGRFHDGNANVVAFVIDSSIAYQALRIKARWDAARNERNVSVDGTAGTETTYTELSPTDPLEIGVAIERPMILADLSFYDIDRGESWLIA